MQSVGLELKSWREREGLSKEAAAVRLGVSLATYVRWEAGKIPRSLAGIAAIKRELAQQPTEGK